MAQVYDNKYQAERKRVQREIAKRIYEYHAWEKMPGESDKDFRRRFSKRIVIVLENDEKVIMGPFGKVLNK